jgi:RNA polymerase sigma-70 factor (ECF subfamily)
MDLLEPVHQDCQRWAYTLTREHGAAEDIFAQSILIGLTKIHQLNQDGAFKTWMFTIIKNTFRQSLRRESKQPEAMPPEDLSFRSPRDEDWTERQARSIVLWGAIERLSPDQREALVLFEMHGLSIKEICRVMNKKDSAVRVLLHRSRQRLAELLRRDGIEE